jgi:hypothetical protein
VIFSLLVKPLSFPLFSGHIRGHFHLRMCDLDCYFVLCLFPNERPFRLGSAYNLNTLEVEIKKRIGCMGQEVECLASMKP